MTAIGHVPVDLPDGPLLLRPLCVRELVGMQRLLARRMADATIADGRAAELPADELMRRAAEVREQAMLTSWLIRWAFQLEGAYEILLCALEGDQVRATAIAAALSPDDLTHIALQLLGFEWSDAEGKWVSRSRAGVSGSGTG